MGNNFELQPIVALISGVCILVFPKLLNYIIAAYLIITGAIGVFDISVNLK